MDFAFRRMRPPRLAGFPYMGCHQYFLTICTFERRRHFTCAALVGDLTMTFRRTARQEQFTIPAYCFMPDHLHMLVEGQSDWADLRAFINNAKQRSAYVARLRISDRLWQAGYFDRVLRETDDGHAVARYIVQNPVRAGLVLSAGDYPFSGSSILSTEELAESTMWRPDAP
jgi:putative transposase